MLIGSSTILCINQILEYESLYLVSNFTYWDFYVIFHQSSDTHGHVNCVLYLEYTNYFNTAYEMNYLEITLFFFGLKILHERPTKGPKGQATPIQKSAKKETLAKRQHSAKASWLHERLQIWWTGKSIWNQHTNKGWWWLCSPGPPIHRPNSYRRRYMSYSILLTRDPRTCVGATSPKMCNKFEK